MAEYLMYLRKSSLDRDFDDAKGETLSRHKSVLTDFANQNGYHIAHIFEEVVSGDSLASRPEMQKCLEYVNTGNYDGVLCMDIDRLSRGSSFDSGYITNILQVNDCKIITPQKTYDLSGEYDEQFTDLKFMFARMELRSIAKRTHRGREASVKEGKGVYPNPYGYDIVNIPGTKGKTLAINEREAEIVRLIFSLSGKGIGQRAIAEELIRRNVPPIRSSWALSSIQDILKNKVYLGYVPHNVRHYKKVVREDGSVGRKLVEGNGEWIKGLHPAIITEDDWELSQRARQNQTHIAKDKHPSNMFAGLIKCKYCGKVMLSVSSKGKNCKKTQYALKCKTPLCPTTSTTLIKAEKIIIADVENRLKTLSVSLEGTSNDVGDKIYTQKLNSLKKALTNAESRQNKICEYLENGTYTLEVFAKRNEAIQREIDEIKAELSSLDKPIQKIPAADIPKYNSLIEIYWEMPPESKNKFLKAIISEITYDRISREIEPTFDIKYKL